MMDVKHQMMGKKRTGQGHGAPDQLSCAFQNLSKRRNMLRLFIVIAVFTCIVIIMITSSYSVLGTSRFVFLTTVHQKLTQLTFISRKTVPTGEGTPQQSTALKEGLEDVNMTFKEALRGLRISWKWNVTDQPLKSLRSEASVNTSRPVSIPGPRLSVNASRPESLGNAARPESLVQDHRLDVNISGPQSPVNTPRRQSQKNSEQWELFYKGLLWRGAPLQKGSPHWQMLDDEFAVFVYSAHFDDAESRPLVRIVGFAMEFLPFVNVTCRFYTDSSRGGGVLYSIRGQVYHFRNRNGRKYIGAYVDCPLEKESTSTSSLPFAVSVSKAGEEEVENNYMVVHYSQSQERLQQYLSNIGSNISNAGLTQHAEDGSGKINNLKSGEALGARWQWNLTRCFPALWKNFNRLELLTEMVAASRAVGVQHFVFYVASVSPEVLRMLQVLESEGVAEVHAWNLNLPERIVFYSAQFASIQDCLYRHLSSSRFLLFGDLDELFVPRTERTLLPLLDKTFHDRPDCGAFLVRNTFFNLNMATKWPPLDVDPAGFAKQHHLDLLGHIRREIKAMPAGARSKPAVDPRKVMTGSVHIVQTLRKGFKSCVMDTNLGLLHHYRHLPKPPENATGYMNDPYLWQYTGEIITQVKFFYERFNKTVSRPYP